MQAEQYQELALRTESPVTSQMIDRIFKVKSRLEYIRQAIVELGKCGDDLKRFVYYGDTSKEYTAPGFQFTFDMRPSIPGDPGIEHQLVRVIHAWLGLLTEVSEMAEVLPFIGHSELEKGSLENLFEENGDIQWYSALMSSAIGRKHSEVQERNIAKLAKRYPDKFDSVKALDRDIEKEQEALNSPTSVPHPGNAITMPKEQWKTLDEKNMYAMPTPPGFMTGWQVAEIILGYMDDNQQKAHAEKFFNEKLKLWTETMVPQ